MIFLIKLFTSVLQKNKTKPTCPFFRQRKNILFLQRFLKFFPQEKKIFSYFLVWWTDFSVIIFKIVITSVLLNAFTKYVMLDRNYLRNTEERGGWEMESQKAVTGNCLKRNFPALR